VFIDVGSATDSMDADGRIAECLVFAGMAEASLERANAALAKAEAQEGVSGQTPLLQRVRGWALMQLGRTDEAREAFDAALAVSSAREAPYETALTLGALAQLSRLEGLAPDPEDDLESRRILTELGVVAVPVVPDHAVPDEALLLPEPTVDAAPVDLTGAEADLLRGSEPGI
jgi:tetratricopeptide (TPR) repeat protein